MPTSEWVCKNTTLKGKPFSFKGYEFQRQIIDDLHPNLSCIKISQVGLTESQMRKMAAFLHRNQGTNGLFTQPDLQMRDKLGKTRVKLMIEENAVFNGEDDKGATRTSTLYQIGRSFLAVTACNESDATGFPGDILFIDEVDLSDQTIVALFGSRLQNSDWKIRQDFSTPTHVSYGIDASFGLTDGHEYFMKCQCCGHQQVPDFEFEHLSIPGLPELPDLAEIEKDHLEGVDLSQARVICRRCSRPLDLGDSERREWVPAYPGRVNARGYRVRPFSTAKLPPSYIIGQLLVYKQRNFIRGWYNTVLGRPYTGGNQRLQEEDINACLDQASVPDLFGRPISVGIDSGVICHVVLFDGADPATANPFSFETVHSDHLVEHVKMLSQRYQIVTGGMDRHPQPTLANQVREASGGKIWPIEYRGSKDLQAVQDELKNITHFQTDRTTSLDRVQTRVRTRTLKMAGYGAQKAIVVDHLRNMVRNEEPEKPAVWVKLKQEDHYFHAIGNGLTSMKISPYLSSLVDGPTQTVLAYGSFNQKMPQGLLNTKSHVVTGPLG